MRCSALESGNTELLTALMGMYDMTDRKATEQDIAGRLDALVMRCKALERGNTELLSALMGMVEQFFLEENGICKHSFMIAEEQAIKVLIKAGYASEVEGGGYVLDHAKLDKRMQSAESGYS